MRPYSQFFARPLVERSPAGRKPDADAPQWRPLLVLRGSGFAVALVAVGLIAFLAGSEQSLASHNSGCPQVNACSIYAPPPSIMYAGVGEYPALTSGYAYRFSNHGTFTYAAGAPLMCMTYVYSDGSAATPYCRNDVGFVVDLRDSGYARSECYDANSNNWNIYVHDCHTWY